MAILALLLAAAASAAPPAPSAPAAPAPHERCLLGEWVQWGAGGPWLKVADSTISTYTATGHAARSGTMVYRARLELRSRSTWREVGPRLFRSIELWDTAGLFGQVKGWKLLRTEDAKPSKEAVYPGHAVKVTLEFPVDQTVEPARLILSGEDRRLSFDLKTPATAAPPPAELLEADGVQLLDTLTWANGSPAFRVSSASVAGKWYDGKAPWKGTRVLRLFTVFRSSGAASFDAHAFTDAAVLSEGDLNLAAPETRLFKAWTKKWVRTLVLKDGAEVPVVIDIPLVARGTPASVVLVRDGKTMELRLSKGKP